MCPHDKTPPDPAERSEPVLKSFSQGVFFFPSEEQDAAQGAGAGEAPGDSGIVLPVDYGSGSDEDPARDVGSLHSSVSSPPAAAADEYHNTTLSLVTAGAEFFYVVGRHVESILSDYESSRFIISLQHR